MNRRAVSRFKAFLLRCGAKGIGGSSTGVRVPARPRLQHRAVIHVDATAWPPHLRAAPSRTSLDSTVESQNLSFERPASHDHPSRREFIPTASASIQPERFTRRLLAPAYSRFQDGGRLSPRPYLPPYMLTEAVPIFAYSV